ncbi:hypothetical protein LSTR_LSTR001876 [Laodelphax striatellus]|uniref:Vesicular, overexpressed in cancer, prosurvival protein 1 n=1 Tax=Laodelphax striatellus TaxID=195883 RepID=A0A482WGJ2_LAOST|nr:hypothetical protein LSTR_LSTR001876 [Laodelphax striatellus]
MARPSYMCNLLLKNITLPPDCQTASTVCCVGQCCFVNRHRKEVWENWYFWFVVILICLLVVTSFISYLAGSCKRKRHRLIRIRHTSRSAGSAPAAAVCGPEGIIQPHLLYNKKPRQHHTAFISNNPEDLKVEDVTGPLSPPYPPVQQVTIVRGSAPPLGFRQTSTYTELVLPPGYVDTDPHSKR